MSIYDEEVRFIRPAMFDDTYYKQTVSSLGLALVLEVGFNERINKRWVSIRNLSGDILLKRTFVSLDSLIDLNINTRILGYTCSLGLQRLKNYKNESDFLNWSSSYQLYITINSIDVTDENSSIWRDILVNTHNLRTQKR